MIILIYSASMVHIFTLSRSLKGTSRSTMAAAAQQVVLATDIAESSITLPHAVGPEANPTLT